LGELRFVKTTPLASEHSAAYSEYGGHAGSSLRC